MTMTAEDTGGVVPDLTLEQIAAELQVGPETVRLWLTRGGAFPNAYRLPAKRSGWRVPRADLEAFKAQRRRESRQ